jgi:HK97 family phage major capsid protein
MNKKDKLTKLLLGLKDEEKNLRAAVLDGDTKEERLSAQQALDKVIEKIKDINDILAELDEPAEPAEPTEPKANGTDDGKNGKDVARSKFNVLDTMKQSNARQGENIYTSIEYRKAFQHYIATGDKEQLRATTKTTDTNIDTVIPENLADKILEKMEQLGVILNLVTKTSLPVGQSFPVDGIKPTATWVGRNDTTPASSTNGEGVGSTPQSKKLGALISFNHYKLRCEIRMTEEVATMALPMFEALFVKQVSEAMVRAKEYAVVDGDGYGMPTGILSTTAPTGQALQVKALDYKSLCEAEAAIPAEYENTTRWCMTKKTFMSYIGMTDTNGQPIARINYGINGKPERTLLGREVVIYSPQANSKLASFSDTLEAGSIFAFLFDFSDYILNENYNLGIQHAIDWDNEDHKTKAVLACDGKVLVNDSLITIAKNK